MNASEVQIKNHFGFDSFNASFSDKINVFIGESCTGKTKILELLESASRLQDGTITPEYLQSKNFHETEASISFSDNTQLQFFIDKSACNVITDTTKNKLNLIHITPYSLFSSEDVDPSIKTTITSLEQKPISSLQTRLFSIIDSILQGQNEVLLLLDIPEAGIHPKEYKTLAKKLMEINGQVFIITHSYLLIKELEFAEIPMKIFSFFKENDTIKYVAETSYSTLSYNSIAEAWADAYHKAIKKELAQLFFSQNKHK